MFHLAIFGGNKIDGSTGLPLINPKRYAIANRASARGLRLAADRENGVSRRNLAVSADFSLSAISSGPS